MQELLHKSGLLAAAFAAIAAVGSARTQAADQPTPVPAPQTAPSAADVEFFEKSIHPLLAGSCYACHSAKSPKPQGELRLDSAAALLKGGSRGPAVAPGRPEDSLLLRAVEYRDPAIQMPPKGKLPPDQIAALTEWVRRGAPWPLEVQSPKSKVQSPKSSPERPTPNAQRPTPNAQRPAPSSHWSYLPLRRPSLPAVRDAAWCRTPVDRFILAALEAKGLRPAPPADPRTLIRRVTYDLTGLPPTPAEVEQFVAECAQEKLQIPNSRFQTTYSKLQTPKPEHRTPNTEHRTPNTQHPTPNTQRPTPNAYTRLVDRLLASPHYGERWARHWLDLVRYAETDGHEFDFDKPNAWRYRDYVIRALNGDLPYDRFVTEHVAGDLLPNPRVNPENGCNESVVATGFAWLGEGTHSPVDLLEDQAGRTDNQIDVFGKTFFGLTVGCARCHDHKFDAISQKDYYGLYSYFQSSRFQLASIDPPDKVRAPLHDLEALDGQLRPLLVGGLQPSQPREAGIAGALLASLTAPGRPSPGDAAASDAWLKYVRTTEGNPDDLFYPWAVLATGSEGSTPERFRSAKASLLAALKAEAGRPASDARREVFEDFSKPGFEGWFVTGEAFGAGPVAAPAARLTPDGPRPASGVSVPGVADSGRISERLWGALRSRDFTLEKPLIYLRMAGEHATVNLIIDGFQRIRAPIYGGLKLEVQDPRPRWYAIDVQQWKGHRAYLELLDDGPGFIAVDRIVFLDGGAPAPPNPFVLRMLESPTVDSTESLARAYRSLFAETARLWAAGELERAADRRDRLELLQWLGVNGVPEELTAGASAATAPELRALLQKRRAIEARIPPPNLVMALADGTQETERVHLRGSPKNLGEPAPRRLLAVLGGEKQTRPAQGSGRLELARRMVAQPLLARVLVNRVWQHHFGEGLVRTPDDFGVRGERPTHPELLDWLAAVFTTPHAPGMEVWKYGSVGAGSTSTPPHTHTPTLPGAGWSLKKLHRLLVLSATYQQSAADAPAAPNREHAISNTPRPSTINHQPSTTAPPNPQSADPQNRLLHHFPVRRLEAEAIRDAILAVSGRLDGRTYGPGVAPYLTPFMQGRGRPAASGPLDGDGRRSIYVQVRRNFLTPLFLAFDYPVPFSTVGKRSVSTVPAQALILMNNPFVLQQAEFWAKRELATPASGARERVSRMYETAYARPPDAGELETALAFLAAQDRTYGTKDDLRSWRDLAHVLMNAKEFIFVD